jgi:predicted ATP-grasp superfamily ATP-dependent carboligase
VEVLELASQRTFLPEHKAACCGESVSIASVVPTCCLAKVILYAASDMTISVELNRQVLPEYAWLADTPSLGTRVPSGNPVCTLLCKGETPGLALNRAENLVPNALVSDIWLRDLPE